MNGKQLKVQQQRIEVRPRIAAPIWACRNDARPKILIGVTGSTHVNVYQLVHADLNACRNVHLTRKDDRAPFELAPQAKRNTA